MLRSRVFSGSREFGVGLMNVLSQNLKIGLRAIVELRASRVLRLWVMKSEEQRERDFVRRVAADVGLRFLGDGGEKEFEPSEQRTTLFILGSGASIESISDEGFQKIRAGFSIGVNAWPLHHFVPDVYAYEPVDDEASDHFRTLSLLDRPEVIERLPSLLILRPRNQLEQFQLDQIPKELVDRTFLYGRLTPATRKVRNLSGDLVEFLRGALRRRAVTALLDSGATIVRLASLGLVLGYKRIVFVGVDLNNSRYFWEENPHHLSRLGIDSFDSGQRQAVHETMNSENRPFVVTDILRSLSDVAESVFAAQFFVESEHSALSEFLPPFRLGR